MSVDEHRVAEELKSCQTKDPVLSKALDKCWGVVSQSEEVDRLNELALYVIDFEGASPTLRESRYYTPNCQALLLDNIVVVNECFLREIEAALRSFDLSGTLLDSPYLKGDEGMYGLIKTIRPNPRKYADRMRRFWAKDESVNKEAMLDELANLLLFFVSHEVGHLLDKVDQRSFGEFLEPDAPLEHRISNAVIKLCRHIDEFERLGFSLPGFGKVAQPHSDIRKKELELRKENEDMYANHTKWFKDEDSADKTATRMVMEYLNKVAKDDEMAAERQQYLLFKALFVAAMYSWDKDLLTFCERLGVGIYGPLNAQSLSVEMMKDREQYVRAASLFGDVHRFTLLRAVLATETWLKERSSYFKMDEKKRTIWYKAEPRKAASESPRAQKEWWLSECLQRHMLLRLLIDTAVKIAYVGGATAWIKEADKLRGTPQLLLMDFRSIRGELELLRRFR